MAGRGETPAIIWEADEPGHAQTYTYSQVLAEVCRVANVLVKHGVRQGDTVAIYMPSAFGRGGWRRRASLGISAAPPFPPVIPSAVFAMLACARIGAIHTVMFAGAPGRGVRAVLPAPCAHPLLPAAAAAGFSAESLRDRILDARAQWVFTADEGRRGGRTIPLKATTDTAVDQCACVRAVFVYAHTGNLDVNYGLRDVRMEVCGCVGGCGQGCAPAAPPAAPRVCSPS